MNNEEMTIYPGQQELTEDGEIRDAEPKVPAEGARPIEEITAEIRYLKARAGEAILEIGNRLIEAKAQLAHGEWEDWLAREVDFSKVTAERFMRLAKEYSKTSPVTLLGASKALILLALPPSEREDFAAEKHEVGGEEKTALEMTKRELEQAVKARLEAEKRASEKDLMLSEMKGTLKDKERAYKDRIEEMEAELEELRNAPKNVTAIEKVPDREKEEKLEAEIAKLKEKAEKAKAERKALEDKLAGAEASVKAAQEKEAATARAGEEAKKALEDQIEKLNRKMKSDTAIYKVRFKVYYEQIDNIISKMLGEINQLEIEGLTEDRAKLKAAGVKIFSEAAELFKEV